MGRVYLAEHVRMGRKSAVKVLNPTLAASADGITRFNREAANASRINHPNVAAIYDFGETSDGTLYLAMEFVEGETLTALLERERSVDVARAAQLIKQAADALAAAHHLGIVHRDLKPDNIMIARQLDGSDWVKVVDFGIAKTVGERSGSQTVTTAGISIGTPEYMSPEQLAGEKLDARTDVYSLALVLFNMLTGTLPYPRLTSRETLVRRLTSPPSTLAEVMPDGDWPVALQRALDRALAPELDERYSSVGDFGRDVLEAVATLDPDRTVRVANPFATSRPSTTRKLEQSALSSASTPLPMPPRRRRSRTQIFVGAAIILAATATMLLRAEPFGGESAIGAPPSKIGSSPSATIKRPETRPTPPTTAPTRSDTSLQEALAEAAAWQPDSTTKARPHKPLAPDGAVATNVRETTHQDSTRAAIDDVRGHVEKARHLMLQGRPLEAQREFRDAAIELRALRSRLDSSGVRQLDAAMIRVRQQSYDACVVGRSRAADEQTAARYQCERMLGRPMGLGRRERTGQQ